jgi:sugar phosphate isomerase/epimerase
MTWTLSYCTLDRSTMFDMPETLEAQFRSARRAGFPMITPDIFSLRSYRDAHGSVDALGRVAKECDIEVYDLSGVTITDDADTSLADVDEFIEFAGALGATWVQSRMPVDNAESRAVYREAARRVSDAGFGFAFEYSPFVPLDRLRKAAEFIGSVAEHTPRQSVIIDTWHFYRSGDTLDDLRALDPALFGYLQVDDALPLGPDLRYDTLNRRAMPGEGLLPLREFLEGCASCGLDGVLSVEVMSETHRGMDLDEYIDTVMRTTRDLVASVQS